MDAIRVDLPPNGCGHSHHLHRYVLIEHMCLLLGTTVFGRYAPMLWKTPAPVIICIGLCCGQKMRSVYRLCTNTRRMQRIYVYANHNCEALNELRPRHANLYKHMNHDLLCIGARNRRGTGRPARQIATATWRAPPGSMLALKWPCAGALTPRGRGSGASEDPSSSERDPSPQCADKAALPDSPKQEIGPTTTCMHK